MNRAALLFSFLLASVFARAQSNVVDWTFSSKKVAGNQYEVRLAATVKSPWHIYSTTQPEGGPLPTKITFAKNPLATPDGRVKEEGKMQSHYEEVFSLDTKFFNDRVEFVQLVNVKGSAKTTINGTVEYMACTDKQCLSPKSIPFSIALK